MLVEHYLRHTIQCQRLAGRVAILSGRSTSEPLPSPSRPSPLIRRFHPPTRLSTHYDLCNCHASKHIRRCAAEPAVRCAVYMLPGEAISDADREAVFEELARLKGELWLEHVPAWELERCAPGREVPLANSIGCGLGLNGDPGPPLYALALYLSAGGGKANPEQTTRHQVPQDLGCEGLIALGMDEAGAN